MFPDSAMPETGSSELFKKHITSKLNKIIGGMEWFHTGQGVQLLLYSRIQGNKCQTR